MGFPIDLFQSCHQQGHHGEQILPRQPRGLPPLGLRTRDVKVPELPAERCLPGGGEDPSGRSLILLGHRSVQTLYPLLPPALARTSSDGPASVRDSPERLDSHLRGVKGQDTCDLWASQLWLSSAELLMLP